MTQVPQALRANLTNDEFIRLVTINSELSEALRELLTQCDGISARCGWPDNAPLHKAAAALDKTEAWMANLSR
jgi:hypothetical protein